MAGLIADSTRLFENLDVKDKAPEIKSTEIILSETNLGSGSFGSVFRGTCRGKEVAIKKLYVQQLDDTAEEDFKREVEIWCKLHHPNICLLMGACTEAGQTAIVTELMPGSVEGLMNNKAKYDQVTLSQRLLMCRDVALGLNWLHGSNPPVIHKDLKPSNLLLDEAGHVKLCDFGLSAHIPKGSAKLQDGDTVEGTILYMSPEVLAGDPYDTKSDIYGYALVAFQIVTGLSADFLFPDSTSFEVHIENVCDKGQRPRIPKEVPPPVIDLLNKCWAPNPDDRPSFDDVLVLLDQAIIHASVNDSHGRYLWADNFGGRTEVPWKDFCEPLLKEVGPLNKTLDFQFRCLAAVLAEVPDDANTGTRSQTPGVLTRRDEANAIVRLEHFGRILGWIGPLNPVPEFLNRLDDLLRKSWFHGYLDAQQADARLKKRHRGYFLVRFSSKPGMFSISRVRSDGTITHHRVEFKPSTGYSVRYIPPQSSSLRGLVTDKKAQTAPKTETATVEQGLPGLLDKLKKDLKLNDPCPGCPFMILFAGSEADSMGGLYEQYD